MRRKREERQQERATFGRRGSATRYLIHSTTQSLVYGKDGSLTITIQREQPQEAAELANWLPAPEGPFYMVQRIYWPEKEALDGTWTPPSVVRMD